MALADQLDKFAKTTPQVKAAATLGVIVVLWGLFLYLFYWDVSDKVSSLTQQVARLKEEKTNYEDKKQKYMAFRAEVTQLLEEQKELIKVLPTKAEIPSFLQSIHAQAELAGLNILSFQQKGQKKKGFYARIPVALTLTGTYHQLNKFFYAVGKMKRIVNISGVKLGNPRLTSTGVQLRAQFVASTFRFLPPKKKRKRKKG